MVFFFRHMLLSYVFHLFLSLRARNFLWRGLKLANKVTGEWRQISELVGGCCCLQHTWEAAVELLDRWIIILEVSTAIYFLICLRHIVLWPLAINISQPKKAVPMTANLNSEQQKLWGVFLKCFLCFVFEKSKYVGTICALEFFLHTCSIMQMITVQP